MSTHSLCLSDIHPTVWRWPLPLVTVWWMPTSKSKTWGWTRVDVRLVLSWDEGIQPTFTSASNIDARYNHTFHTSLVSNYCWNIIPFVLKVSFTPKIIKEHSSHIDLCFCASSKCRLTCHFLYQWYPSPCWKLEVMQQWMLLWQF
jgi:hypothetical protein